MKIIDLTTWKRRGHLEFFQSCDDPTFNLVADVDVTALMSVCKERGLSVFLATVYLVTRAANAVPELRTRLRADGQVVEHEVVHPGFTVLDSDELFKFCTASYHDDGRRFFDEAADQVERARRKCGLVEEEPGRDDLYYMTCIPWVAFTSLKHPMLFQGNLSIPRVAWGKITRENSAATMPVSLQAHHGLCDGVHAGRFFAELQDRLSRAGEELPG